ncbi:conserved domain protein [Peptoniphilus sp. oral taxon 375 str. F0436]|nr:conserved domain protein [Peptoniphilus sp. oral taxon 375 str. F0436]
MSILIGLFASFLMFLGDMILYYDSNDYDGKNTINNIIGIMKNVSIKRLYIGGLLGPICAFIYCIGFYHIVLAIQEKYLTIGWFVFLINIFGIILGGTYHIQCAYLGLLSRYENKGAFDEFLKFLKLQAKIVFGIMAIANIGIALVILFGFTVFPRWQVLFTPMFLLILTPLIGRLPKGLHMIIRGGWFNIIYFIYYLILLINYTNMNL